MNSRNLNLFNHFDIPRFKKPARSIVFLFPGQGSQYAGMARALFKYSAVFQDTVTFFDKQLMDTIGDSIIRRAFHGDLKGEATFDRLIHTHLAIFIIEYALCRLLQTEGISPHAIVGVSMGEFAASAVSNVIGSEEAFKLVYCQAKSIEQNCLPGAMTSVLGDPCLFREKYATNQHLYFAGANHSQHFVVSGDIQNIGTFEDHLSHSNVEYCRLPIQYGFHSKLIDSAKSDFIRHADPLIFKIPTCEYISSVDGCLSAHQDIYHFWNAVHLPFSFIKTIEYLEQKGPHIYIDVGPSGSLASFTKHILKKTSLSQAFAIITPFGREIEVIAKIKRQMQVHNPPILPKKGKHMRAFLFPGQGSQFQGMGGTIFSDFPEFTREADAILGYSIRRLCNDNPDNKLNNTQFAQPALFCVESLMYIKKRSEGENPDYLAGHSLGEYAALFAAEVFDFKTGLRLVKKRAELMSKQADGGMAAIIGFEESQVNAILQESSLNDIDIANINCFDQIVISGRNESLDKATHVFKKAGAKFVIPLKVSGAFHSRFMHNATEAFSDYITSSTFHEPSIPVVSGANAELYSAANAKTFLAAQMQNTVRWTACISYLKQAGVENFVEVGPGNVLKKLLVSMNKNASHCRFIKETSLSESRSEESILHHASNRRRLQAQFLGSEAFCRDYNVNLAYAAGAMYKGIASRDLVIKMSKAGLLSFLGTGGLSLSQIKSDIKHIRKMVPPGSPWGVNLLFDHHNPNEQMDIIDTYLQEQVTAIEAAAFTAITPALVKFRLAGITEAGGKPVINNKIIAKVSRPEIASLFLSPPPEALIKALLNQNLINTDQAALGRQVAMCDDLCVEADSGGHTDMGVAYALMPTMIHLRDLYMHRFSYSKRIRVGAAGGIGSPQAAAAAFILGADFIVTGSVNQCTVESGASSTVKEMLQEMNVQDTAYAPAGDMFEIGAKIQVFKRGVFFPARANKLYLLYKNFNSLESIDLKTRKQLQDIYFKKSFEDIWRETEDYFSLKDPKEIDRAMTNPKHKMALIFRWYFAHTARLALEGDPACKTDFQVHCGPALGSYNQCLSNEEILPWRKRYVDQIAEFIMDETAKLLTKRIGELSLKTAK